MKVIFHLESSGFIFSDEYPIKYKSERLAPLIVVDLNGDFKVEVLVATHDAKIQIQSFEVELLVPELLAKEGGPGTF